MPSQDHIGAGVYGDLTMRRERNGQFSRCPQEKACSGHDSSQARLNFRIRNLNSNACEVTREDHKADSQIICLHYLALF